MKGTKRFNLLWMAGLLLILVGVIGLVRVPKTLQYVFAPGGEKLSEGLQEAEKRWDRAFQPVSLHGISQGVSLTAGDKNQGEVTLYQVDGSFFQAYPRPFTEGRPLSPGDAGGNAIVLDHQLAFLLFGDHDPLGQKVRIGEEPFEVCGLSQHTRRTGETGMYAAWIPLGSVQEPAAEIMVLTVAGHTSSDAATIVETACNSVFGKGQLLDLRKESIRGLIILWVLFTAIVIRLMMFWLAGNRNVCGRWIVEIREKLKTRYPRQMAGQLLLVGLGMVLLWAAFVATGAALVMLAAELMKVFPEWVPEELLSVAAVVRRFWELTARAAQPVHWQTPEMAEIRLWSGVVRWGVLVFLLGFLFRKRKAGKEVQATPKDEAA